MRERVQRATQARRFALVLLGLFAAVALVLSAVGLYGVISYTVAERRREIAVRMAVGASARGVLLLVIRRGLRPVVAGIAVGLAGTLALSRVLDAMLFGISRTDPLTLGAVVLVLFATAVVACLVPALRGARTAPMEVLRME
jgi:putative ABC transport system permease protein